MTGLGRGDLAKPGQPCSRSNSQFAHRVADATFWRPTMIQITVFISGK